MTVGRGKIIGVLGLMVLVSGCGMSTVSQNWQCPINQGRGCQTITDADSAYGKNRLGKSFVGIGQTASPVPKRTKEIIGKIYFYPFVDSKGNYHKGDVVYKVFKPSTWSK